MECFRYQGLGFGRYNGSFLTSCTCDEDYDTYMYLSEDAKTELCFWETLPDGLCSLIMLLDSTQSLDTDAIDSGIGMCFKGVLVSEEAAEGHINVAELAVLDRALDRFKEIRPGVLSWQVDNNSALANIQNQGSMHSWSLSCLAVSIL